MAKGMASSCEWPEQINPQACLNDGFSSYSDDELIEYQGEVFVGQRGDRNQIVLLWDEKHQPQDGKILMVSGVEVNG